MVTKKAKKKQTQLCNARKIISSFYFKVFTLRSYIDKVKNEKGTKLIQDGDPADYIVILKSTLVAVPRDQSATLPFKPSHNTCFTLKDIINRVIERVCHSNKTNVLAFGFEKLSGNDRNGTVAGTHGIQNSYPNSIVSYLRTAKAWQVLHDRIGDDLMIHLLQNVAMFVKGASKCYFQVAGFPISQLSPLTAKDVPPEITNNKQSSKPENDSKEATTKRKVRRGGKRVRRFCKKLSSQKEDITAISICEDESDNPLDLEHVDDVVTCKTITNSSAVTGYRKRKASDNDVKEIYIKKARKSFNVVEASPFAVDDIENSNNYSANGHAARSSFLQNQSELAEYEMNTRCNDIEMNSPMDGLPERSATEVSPLLFPEETSDKSMDESCHYGSPSELESSKNFKKLYQVDDVATALFEEATDERSADGCVDGRPVDVDVYRSQEKEMKAMPVEKKDSLKRKKATSNSSVEVKEMVDDKAVNRRKPWKYLLKLLPQSEQIKSLADKEPAPKGQEKSLSQKKTKVQPDNKEGRPTSKKNSQGVCLNEVYLPRSRIFYASNLSQTFPKNHIMETTPVGMAGARRLVHHIFMQRSCMVGSSEKGNDRKEMQNAKNVTGAMSNQKKGSKKGKPFRLPKRLTRMQPIALKFLARHQKCPFRTLLKHHCFYTCNGREGRRVRLKRSGKKKGFHTRTAFNIPKRMMWHKQPWKKGRSKVSKRAHREKKARVDMLVYRHAVSNFTRHDQVHVYL